ncbi:amidohydrolase family protein [Phycisphaerales bacterium AB-hyl4]|uniref:Amidohydrolase family protein n=1 Tax=Natronomicrosphaera hydrolytica TaxID=3242702 RepID=A0ABV4U388_9BACT
MSTNTPNPANQLDLDYREQARRFRWSGPIFDAHSHINTVEAAELYVEVAELYGVKKTWTMSQLEQVDPLRERFGDRFEFIAVPNYAAKDEPGTFTTDWRRRIERFAEKGVKVCKLWAAPRGLDLDPEAMKLDTPERREQMRLARSLGMMFMTHVADPDTWFATHYADASRYGRKQDHYEPLKRVLDDFGDVPWIAAHMAGSPENLPLLQQLLDTYENLYFDTSATKWMVRELSKHADAFADFARRNRGRLLFGSDIVASADNRDFDLYASRYWALRTLMETDYVGRSPIVDPDLSLVDPSLPAESTAKLRGANLDDATLRSLYHDAADAVLNGWARR